MNIFDIKHRWKSHTLDNKNGNAESHLLDSYNVSWKTLSKDSSESMPIGNGDITANLWVELNGDLCFYIGKSDTWSEATRLLKLGKVRVKIIPNPFSVESPFLQELKLNEGEICITTGKIGEKATLRVWVDANNEVIHVEILSEQPIQIEASIEIWRDSVINMDSVNASSYRGISDYPVEIPSESADQILSRTDKIIWYHRNDSSLYYQRTLDSQNLKGFENIYPDPYINRTFGACIKGKNMVNVDDTKLRSSANGTYFSLSVYPYTAITNTISEWEEQMYSMIANIEAINLEAARINHLSWWKNFWNRSWIFITGNDDAIKVTRGYILQRYMQAIQGRGAYPIKFNGGTINFDYDGKNADFREWGPCYWFQNTRHLYWNMLASGDYEMMLPLFYMYKNILNLQMDITLKYFRHKGAFFSETLYFHGLYSSDDFGWDNTDVLPKNEYIKYYWQGGLELTAMMLEYYEYKRDNVFVSDILIPFAEQIIMFYDEHYARVDGVLNINPAHVLETYFTDVTNPTEVVAGLRQVLPKLLALPKTLTTQLQRNKWQSLFGALPPIPVGTNGQETYIKPAQKYDTGTSNCENPELYAVFPYKQYGVGKIDLDVGIETFNRRIFTENGCWRQNGIHAAYLGLADAAKEAVITHFSLKDPSLRFPGYWLPYSDWMPDLDNGGSAMTALQGMVLQCNGDEIRVLPAWPSEWNVDFKLHAADNTTVRVKYENEDIICIETYPSSRMQDVKGI